MFHWSFLCLKKLQKFMRIATLKEKKRKFIAFLEHSCIKIKSKIYRDIIEKIIRTSNECFFIEIGAWDGVKDDPFYEFVVKYNLNGIYIEPQKEGFQKLTNNYRHCKNVILENAAIAEEGGIGILYTIISQNGEIGEMAVGQSTLKKNLALRIIEYFSGSKYEKQFNRIKEESIIKITIRSLLKKYNIKKVDILQIDTEGYDYKIIKTIPFDLIKPKFIRYEWCHLTKDDQQKSITFLKEQGYHIIRLELDNLALLDLQVSTANLFVLKFLNYMIKLLSYISPSIIWHKLAS